MLASIRRITIYSNACGGKFCERLFPSPLEINALFFSFNHFCSLSMAPPLRPISVFAWKRLSHFWSLCASPICLPHLFPGRPENKRSAWLIAVLNITTFDSIGSHPIGKLKPNDYIWPSCALKYDLQHSHTFIYSKISKVSDWQEFQDEIF